MRLKEGGKSDEELDQIKLEQVFEVRDFHFSYCAVIEDNGGNRALRTTNNILVCVLEQVGFDVKIETKSRRFGFDIDIKPCF